MPPGRVGDRREADRADQGRAGPAAPPRGEQLGQGPQPRRREDGQGRGDRHQVAVELLGEGAQGQHEEHGQGRQGRQKRAVIARLPLPPDQRQQQQPGHAPGRKAQGQGRRVVEQARGLVALAQEKVAGHVGLGALDRHPRPQLVDSRQRACPQGRPEREDRQGGQGAPGRQGADCPDSGPGRAAAPPVGQPGHQGHRRREDGGGRFTQHGQPCTHTRQGQPAPVLGPRPLPVAAGGQ